MPAMATPAFLTADKPGADTLTDKERLRTWEIRRYRGTCGGVNFRSPNAGQLPGGSASAAPRRTSPAFGHTKCAQTPAFRVAAWL